MRAQVHSLLARHHAKILNEVALILETVSVFKHLSPAESDDFVRQVHTLKGSSGTMGFDRVFIASQALEAELRTVDEAQTDGSLEKISFLATKLHDEAINTQVTDSTLYGKF